MTQSVHRRMHFRSFAFLMSVKTSAPSTLRRGLNRPAVQNDGAGIGFSIQGQTQNGPQVVGHGFETTGFDPTLGLLPNHAPRWQIMGHHPPSPTHPNLVA